MLSSGSWCSGITSASHAEGPGFNPQWVHFQKLTSAISFATTLFHSCLYALSCQFARVVKGVDLRSTAGNCAWARTPQLTILLSQVSTLLCVDEEKMTIFSLFVVYLSTWFHTVIFSGHAGICRQCSLTNSVSPHLFLFLSLSLTLSQSLYLSLFLFLSLSLSHIFPPTHPLSFPCVQMSIMHTRGIEPRSQAWKACMMPLHYVCDAISLNQLPFTHMSSGRRHTRTCNGK